MGSFLDWMTGTMSDSAYNALPQVSAPNASAYQLGLGGYQNQLAGLTQQAGGLGFDTTNMNADRGSQMANIGQLQVQAAGQGPSPAQVMLQQNQQAALRNMQAQALTSQAGSMPGLAFRGLMNAQGALQAQNAAQGALMQQQSQQQAQLQLAQQLSSLRQQDFGQASAVTQNQRQNLYDQAGFVGQQAGMQQAQGQANMDLNRAQIANQMYARSQAQARQQALASENQMLMRGLGAAAGTGLGALAGGPMGAMVGGQLGGSLFGGGGGANGGLDPAMLAMLMQSQGGGNAGTNLAGYTQQQAGLPVPSTAPTVQNFLANPAIQPGTYPVGG